MLSRIIRLYRAEIELFWKWRMGRWALIKRGLIALLAAVLAINLTAWLLPGLVTIDQLGGGLLAVIFVSALNGVQTKPFLVHPAEWEVIWPRCWARRWCISSSGAGWRTSWA